MITKEQAIDIVETFEFFQGQRAGRELWASKEYSVQEADLTNFKQDCYDLLEYLENTETETDEMRRYGAGMIIGRFQPFHIGHYSILKRALEECSIVVVLLGSAQESRLPHNPLSAAERQSLIEDCFPEDRDRLVFLSVEDRPTISNDKSWGEYLFGLMKDHCRVIPEVVYEGKELVRKDWYDTLDVNIIQLSRKVFPISATQLRKMILANDNNWRHYCPKGAESHYEKLKEILKDVIKDRSSN